jgi:hypothetical protein
MRLRADCSKPSIQAVPSLQPVVLEKFVNTYAASVLGEVERSTILITTTLVNDQYTNIAVSMSLLWDQTRLTGTLVPAIEDRISKDVQQYSNDRYCDEH